MIIPDIQTLKKELETLITAWVNEKKILDTDEVMEVHLSITKISKINVNIEGHRDLKDINQKSVDDLGLSTRAWNCLGNAGIQTVGELRTKTKADLFQHKNFGKKSIKEIQDKLLKLGIEVNWLP